MRTGRTAALANPVLVGAVTTLVVVVAVFLAYNATNGLPFVPTTQLKAIAPNAQKLVPGNEVREGGQRIGIVEEINTKEISDGSSGAELVLKLDKSAAPLPADTKIRIRPRSALGLRYVELTRGSAADTLEDGDTITVGEEALTNELEDFFEIFDPETRVNARKNLTGFGTAFAGRGRSINQALESLPALLTAIQPVMRTLSAKETRLERFITELSDAATITAPVAERMADGFAAGAQTFEALARDPQALQDSIAKSPDTLRTGTRSLAAQRPFLRHLASLSGNLRATAREIRTSVPSIDRTLRIGTPVLRRTPPLSRRLGDVLGELEQLAAAPGTDLGIARLGDTMGTLNPTLRYVAPFQTVCNYWNSFWTFLSDNLTDKDQTGQIQRIQAKTSAEQEDRMGSFGASRPANGQGYIPGASANNSPEHLHAQPYGAAVTSTGEADCESGQRGYPRRLARNQPAELDIVIDPETPGVQGPTFKGRPRVPEGQTFSSEPGGLSPDIRP